MTATTTTTSPSPAPRPASSAKAGASARRVTPFFSATAIAAEGAGAGPALTARFRVSSRGLAVAIERPGARSAGTVERATARASPSVVGVAVVKRRAPRVVPVVVINGVVVVPIESPVAPAPAEAAEESDAEAVSVERVNSVVPNSGIRVPSRPGNNGAAVDNPGIIRRDVHDLRVGRRNLDRWAVHGNILLRGALEVAGLLGLLAHHLHGVHHVLLLVVVSIAQGGRPGKILVHISKDGRKRGERLDAGIPGFFVDSLTQRLVLQIRMRLHKTVGFDDLFGKRGGRQDLRYQRLRIQRDRRY